METPKIKLPPQATIIIIVVIAVVILILLVGAKFGLFKAKSKEEKELDRIKAQQKIDKKRAAYDMKNAEFANPATYLVGKDISKYDESEIQKKAENFKKSMRFLGTNESRLFSTIESLESKTEFCLVQQKYTLLYNRSLISDIISELSGNDLSFVYKELTKLKNE